MVQCSISRDIKNTEMEAIDLICPQIIQVIIFVIERISFRKQVTGKNPGPKVVIVSQCQTV